MTREDETGPRPLSWSLRVLAGRVRRVDLMGFAAVEAAWPQVRAAAASEAVPLRLTDTELTVAVPTGSHAARARRDAASVLAELAEVLEEPPTALHVVVRPRDDARG